MSVRVLIADDDPLFRETLRLLLDAEAGFEVVAEATNGDDAVRLATEVRPDAVLLDVQMGVLNGVEAADRIRTALPGALILIHTGLPTVLASTRSLELGFEIRDKYDLVETIRRLSSAPRLSGEA